MDELIPITDFDKRYFPDISEDERINFILHSNDFERITMKFEEIQSQLLIPTKGKPAVQGQKRCLEYVIDLASNPDLMPPANQITPAKFDKLFSWFPYFHKNLMYDFSRKGEELLNQIDYPHLSELGTYRNEDKSLGHRVMPRPDQIKPLLAKAFTRYCKTYDTYREGFSNPRLIETHDWKILEQATHRLGLDICCIKPFQDGSNRIARLVENLTRLNVGLKFKINTDKNAYLKEIWELQDSEYKNI